MLMSSFSLCRYKIIKASVGKNHTVVVTDDGKSFAFGHNKFGQLGTGSLKNGWHFFHFFVVDMASAL